MTKLNTIEEAIVDLKRGRMIIVVDDENRENEGDFVMCADMITPEAVNFMATFGRGMICAPITQEIADRLELPLQVNQNNAPLGTAFTVTVDAIEGVSTGISAKDRAITLKLLADPNATAAQFSKPGHIFPLIAKKGGVLVREGHTEASVDLAVMCGMNPVGVICEIMNEDGSMARLPELEVIAKKFDLKIISIEELVKFRKSQDNLLTQVESVPMPTSFGEFELFVFESDVLKTTAMAIVKGDKNLLSQSSPLLRVHSECFTGDILHSLRCDCGDQLNMALTRIEEEGSGIVVYLKQEGRGIGLMNKVRAYKLQDQGLDTVEANVKLGFAADLRDYTMASQILKFFKIDSARLMTNNPQKFKALQDLGAKNLMRESHQTSPHKTNMNYLMTKKNKLGHWLGSGLIEQ